MARQGGRVRRHRPRQDRAGEPVRQDPRRPALAAVPAQARLVAGATGEDRVQGDAAAMTITVCIADGFDCAHHKLIRITWEGSNS